MNPIYTTCIYVVWFLSTYYVIFFLLMVAYSHKNLYESREIKHRRRPLVSVLVPAYNEESKIAQTIESLKKITYKRIEMIIVNDGSRDKTSKVIRKAIGGDSRFTFIDRAANKGKAFSLNEGITHARGEFIACMDADSIVEPQVMEKVLPYFEGKDVGAVTITVKVKKPRTFLEKIVELEYIIGLSLYLKIFSFFNCVFVTPGPFSVYRKSVLDEIGGFDVNNMTEDLEIAYRIHKAKYRIENCLEASVETIVPPGFFAVYVQRRRWYSGALQTLFKHRDLPFRKKYGMFAYFVPFNYLLVLSGLVLFYASTYLLLSNIGEYVWNLQYTGLNIMRDIHYIDLDPLRLGSLSIVGYMGIFMTFAILFISLAYTKNDFKTKRAGIMGYPLLFFLYQIYWAGAVIAAVRGKKIKWR